jgi:glyoxylase-like metal-dependent hydrolase (beta-lactamase superfamily II)
MAVTRTLGQLALVALEDGAGPFFRPREEVFGQTTAAHWDSADALDPAAAGPAGEWLLRFRCFAVRPDSGAGTVLVDAGIGPAGSPAAAWAPVPGRLPEELAAAGIDPDDVATVVLTHLHTDHIGWAVTDATPYFRNARYLLQRIEYEAVDTLNPSLRERLLQPLQATGQLWLVDGEAALATGVRAIATPGHTPGHQSVLLDSGDEVVLVTGDLLVHAVQLVDPDVSYANEVDPDQARETRRVLLDQLAARGGLLATAHLSEAFLAATPGGAATPSRWAPARPR